MKKLLLMAVVSTMSVSSVLATDIYSEESNAIESSALYEIKTDMFGTEIEVLVPNTKTIYGLAKEKKDLTLADLEKELGLKSGKKPPAKKTTPKKEDLIDKSKKVIAVTRDFIALGKEVYSLVEKGAPVYIETSSAIQILPRSVGNDLRGSLDLQNWSLPTIKRYTYKLRNKGKKVVVNVEFAVIFTPGGDLEGVGKYISGAQIKPTYVNVRWGWKLTATYIVQSLVNRGTHENPVAGATLMIDFQSVNKFGLGNVTQNRIFAIDGLGNITSY